jgi:hypothetical protein
MVRYYPAGTITHIGVRVRQVNSFLILAGAAALFACATQAPQPAARVAPTSPATAAAVAPTQKIDIPLGFNREVGSDGVVRYCSNDQDTDSRVRRTKSCYTAQQLKAKQDNTQSFIDKIQGQGAIATSTGTSGAGGMGMAK